MALTDGLKGLWKLNENAANTSVLDYSGQGNNGVASENTADLTAAGKLDKCFDLDASNSECILCGDMGAVDLVSGQDITIAIWANADNAIGPIDCLYHKFKEGTDKGVVVSFYGGVDVDSVRCWFHHGAGSIACTYDAGVTLSGWYLIIVRIDRDGNMTLYVNNDLKDTDDISTYAATDASNDEEVGIGEKASTNVNYKYFNGKIDEVAVWNRLLTIAEGTELWNSGNGTEDFGLGVSVKPTDATYIKQLVAIAGNELWYENSDQVMTKLTDAAVAGELDCTVPLSMFELYGKVFIVNGTRKKVYDPINVKLYTTDLGTNPPDHGNVLIGDDSDAQMIVDYITNLDDDEVCYIYGRLTTTAKFKNGETISGYDNDENVIDFDLDAAPVESPHWYNWTPYGDADDTHTTFGKMPEYATIGCNYQGRAVISGNIYAPHQWYMARQENPFDFIYGLNDAQSAVAGNDADAGEIGDVVRALVPRKDDYLVFGSVSTMWFLAGNPCDGGTILELDLAGGILGPLAWCFDAEDNLYYMGTSGLMKCRVPGVPVCISDVRLPKLIKDENINPLTHRITLHYDRDRKGILLTITLVADGTNSNYWYDLRTLNENGICGIFPEEYPEECSVFSGCFYEARDPNYRTLILGCYDGYLRFFDDSAEDDNIGDEDERIDSYVTFGPLPMSQDPKFTGKLTELDCILAGGASSGSQSNSNNVAYKIYVANSAEEILEKLSAGSNPNISGTIIAPGRRRGSSIKRPIKGIYMGIKLQNDTAEETWALEQLLYSVKPIGRFK